ncbi:EAL domain-containing protein [Lebetimonas sp. JS138]|uniref:EAL domain-containing protein n=1 Tax=Lebetimonas sp. JS138 TaxID=990072 RepID=UPI0004668720|nr:EAL domain-containing protein [Lebetimonas sp. JS138]
MILSINKPDVKGNYFRKKYLECFKNHKNCFIKYYFKNPKTDKIEEKISYFTLIKNFNFTIAKGIYASQIKNEIKKEIVGQQKEFKKIFLIGIFIYFVLLIILYIVLAYFIKKFQIKIFKEYEELIEELKKRYYFDSLTNLPNRHKLIENLKNYRSLILIDIDDFSDVNDVYGFEAGNEILKSIAKKFLSKYKNVYRAGSDEFVIGFKRKITEKDLCEIANNEYEFNLIEISFSVSGSNEKGKLLKTAESALKEAKKYSENCVLFNEKIEKEQSERIKTIQKLKKVLEYKKIIPYYQCIKGEKEKYEALMRVEIDGKIMPPFYFMDLLKEAKLYHNFSQIMIKKVFDDVKNGKIKNVSINLSFIDIVNEETNRILLNLINNCKKTSEITFEILESESIKDFELIKKFIDYVKSKGIKISIDDFGSGYSNYIRILELKPDFIKIDGTIVKNINNDKYFEIIKLMIEFAKKFNIKTVAEFVENEEIYNKLKNLGIDYYQGYYFCKPGPLDKIKK